MSETYIERCLGLNGILCPIVPINECSSGIWLPIDSKYFSCL